MNFLEKLDFLMKKYDLNKRSLSQKSGIPYTTIDGWYKKGYEGLKLTTFRKLANYFNTTLDYWILDDVSDPNYGKSQGFQVDYSEMALIQKYRALDDYGRETVELVLNREYNRVNADGQKMITGELAAMGGQHGTVQVSEEDALKARQLLLSREKK